MHSRNILSLLVALFLGFRCATLLAAEKTDSYFPLIENALGQGEVKLVTSPKKLKFARGGLLTGGKTEPPVFTIPNWDGSSGSVGYWIQPVDWTASTEKHVVMLQPENGKGGHFLFYGSSPESVGRYR